MHKDDTLSRCEELQEAGQFDDALDLLNEAVLSAPYDSDYLIMRGRLLSLRFSDHDAAIADLLEARRFTPRSCELHQLLSLSYLSLNELDQAQESAETAIEIDPSDFMSYICMGRCMIMKHRFHDAKSSFEAAVTLSPNSELALTGLGESYFSMDEFENAIASSRRASDICPTTLLFIDLARSYLKLGNHEQAIYYLDQANKLPFEYGLDLVITGYMKKALSLRETRSSS